MIIYVNDIGKTHFNKRERTNIVMDIEGHSFYYASTSMWLRLGKYSRGESLSERIM